MTNTDSILDINKVCVAILNYNGIEHLQKFMPDVLEAVDDPTLVCVIDNGSQDESVHFLKSQYPEIRLIQLEENYGFAEGYNRGLKEIQSEYLLLLNSDVSPEPGFLTKMVHFMDQNNGVAAIQPSVLSYNHQEHYEYAGASGGLMDVFRYPFCRGRILNTVEPFHEDWKDREIFWSTGACMLIRRNVFETLGGFAGYYFAHLEEIDLCWRIKRLGYSIMIATEPKIYHLGGGTLSYNSPKKTYLNFRNSLFTLVRNEQVRVLLWLLPSRLLLDLAACLMFFMKGERSNALSVLKARWHYFRRLPQLFRERKMIKETIRDHSIGPSREKVGIEPRSIIFYYYLLSKRRYSEIFKR